jgi:DNA invertase Pin-like site-specific DNA recombinase
MPGVFSAWLLFGDCPHSVELPEWPSFQFQDWSENDHLRTIMESEYKWAQQWSETQERIKMRKIGYARVSMITQNLDRQIGALRAECCDEVYREKASGKAIKGRPQLEKAIDALGTGDVFVIAEWDRATRSMMDGIAILDRIQARGAMVKVLDRTYLDLTTPIGRGILAFLSSLAEDERQRIVKRTHAGLKQAKARGVHLGRKPKLTKQQREIARERLGAGESARAIAREWGVAHTTINRVVL